MYLVKSLRTFFGTNAERIATALNLFLPGDEFHETDTDNVYQHNGMAWVKTAVDGTNYLVITNNLSDLANAATARTNLGLVAGGAGDIWVEKAGDVMTGGLVVNNSEGDNDFRIAGNGVTNGYFYDGGLNRHGFGTGLPDFPVHVLSAESNVVRLERSVSGNVNFQDFYNPDTTDGNLAIWRFLSDTSGTGATEEVTFGNIFCEFDTHNHATRTGKIFFRTLDNGSFDTPMSISGNGIHGIGIGIGLSAPATSAKLEIGGTNGALLLPRMTTTQQNALTAVNGMIIFNSSTGKFTGYAGGAWVALH